MNSKRLARFRPPTADEQQILIHLEVRLVPPEEVPRFDQLLTQHHYLKSAQLVGEHLRYVATYRGQWLALAAWNAPALHLKARDGFIGWSQEQRRARLPLLANNSRLLVLPGGATPNLISRFMKLMLARLSADWQAHWQHPLALAETFVDPHLYQGTAYKASGWQRLGQTLRHAHVELVSAVNGQGRWLGTLPVQEGSNEIPAARQLLAKVPLENKTALADAIHTQVETAQQILFEGGGDYALTVKDNQKELVQTLATLLTAGKFSPSAHGADAGLDPRAQPQPA